MRKFLAFILVLSFPYLCNAGEWHILSGQTPKPEFNTKLVENDLWNYLEKNTKNHFSPRAEYAYQYSFVDEEAVIIHGLCRFHPKGTEKEFISGFILDGGTCYFTIKYSLKNKSFSKLSTHGEA